MEAGVPTNRGIYRDRVQRELKIMSKRSVAAGSTSWASGGFVRMRANPAPQFETRMNALGLTIDTCGRSEKLRRWCQENCHRCYILEWLLKTWGFRVDYD